MNSVRISNCSGFTVMDSNEFMFWMSLYYLISRLGSKSLLTLYVKITLKNALGIESLQLQVYFCFFLYIIHSSAALFLDMDTIFFNSTLFSSLTYILFFLDICYFPWYIGTISLFGISGYCLILRFLRTFDLIFCKSLPREKNSIYKFSEICFW